MSKPGVVYRTYVRKVGISWPLTMNEVDEKINRLTIVIVSFMFIIGLV